MTPLDTILQHMAQMPVNTMFFFSNDTATTEIYTLSLHDALPIWSTCRYPTRATFTIATTTRSFRACSQRPGDRKSTRLNSSHMSISYAVFCLKKKTLENMNLTVHQAEQILLQNRNVKTGFCAVET